MPLYNPPPGWQLRTTVNPAAGSSNQDLTIPSGANDIMVIGYGVAAGPTALCGTGISIYLGNSNGFSLAYSPSLSTSIGLVSAQLFNIKGKGGQFYIGLQNVGSFGSGPSPVLGVDTDSYSMEYSSASLFLSTIRLGGTWVAGCTLEMWFR